jgi:hypothetical protein
MSIPDGTVLYRALRSKNWFNKDTQRIESVAFLRRPTGDEQGLSINYNCQMSECAPALRRLGGVCSLSVDEVRHLGLDAIPDGRNQRVPHGNIVVLPLRSENEAQAEGLAETLARSAKLEWLSQSKAEVRPPRNP